MKELHDGYYRRLCASACSFFLFGLGGIVLGYLVFPAVFLVSRSEEVSTRRCRYLIQQSFRLFIWFMRSAGVLTSEIHGEAPLSRPGQLIIANHPTLIDIVFLISMVPNAVCIVKPQLYRNFFTRGPISRAAYIANDSPDGLIDECVRALEGGSSLIIFPEGTRSNAGHPGPFRRGAAYVYLASMCPMALVAITCEPPTLAKYEKWYNIPSRRPHFTLCIKEAKIGNMDDQPANVGKARELTRQWREYFIEKVEK